MFWFLFFFPLAAANSSFRQLFSPLLPLFVLSLDVQSLLLFLVFSHVFNGEGFLYVCFSSSSLLYPLLPSTISLP
jgi:hypothetical protein